jgi:hypothetical protein
MASLEQDSMNVIVYRTIMSEKGRPAMFIYSLFPRMDSSGETHKKNTDFANLGMCFLLD